MTFRNSRFLQIVTVGVIFSLSAHSANAVNCFVCESHKEVCDSGQCQGEYCSKIMAKSNRDGVTLWTWGCATSTIQSPLTAGCQKTAVSDWTQNACYCKDKDFCNASPPTKKTAAEYIILLSAAVFAVFMSRSA